MEKGDEKLMSNQNDEKNKIYISKDRAIELLFETKETKTYEYSFLDEYGNYTYSTDLTVDFPNTAIGTPLGLSAIQDVFRD